MIPKTDQWKLTGKCQECRRRTYCGSKCKKSKERLAAQLLLGTTQDGEIKEKPFAVYQNQNINFEKKRPE